MGVITSAKVPPARAIQGPGKMGLAALEGASLSTISRPEAFGRRVCGMIGMLLKPVEAPGEAWIDLIGAPASTSGAAHRVRLRVATSRPEERRNGRVARDGVGPECANHAA